MQTLCIFVFTIRISRSAYYVFLFFFFFLFVELQLRYLVIKGLTIKNDIPNYLSPTSYMSPEALLLPKPYYRDIHAAIMLHTYREGKQGRTLSRGRKRDKQQGLNVTSIQGEIRLLPPLTQQGFNLQRCLTRNGLTMSIRNFAVCKSAHVRSADGAICGSTLSAS